MSRHIPRMRTRTRSAALATALTLLLSLIAQVLLVDGPRRVSASGGAFTCSPTLYQVLSGTLNRLNPVTGTYTPIGVTYADTYNAMGYNTVDNFLYAMDTGANQGDLLRIASDGTVTDLGLPTGLPAANYIAGDFDSSGHLIIQASGTTWYSINVSSGVASPLTITGSTGTANDLVWIGGFMYELFGTTPTLRRVDLSTLIATTANVSGISGGSGAYGAGWSDQPNDLFFSDNSGNGVFQITGFSGVSPAGTFVVAGAVTSNNDGAACKLAGSPFAYPVANNDAYAPVAGQVFNVNAASGVIANDTGSPPLTINSSTSPAHGSLTLNADGSFSFTPAAGYSGPDSFTYGITDPYARVSGTATVALTIHPAAADDSYTTPFNTTLVRNAAQGVLANDLGTGLSAVLNAGPAHGGFALSSDGSFTYTPTGGYSGPDSFTYHANDGTSSSSVATVSLTVSPPAAPVANNDSGTTQAGSALNVTAPGVLGNDTGTGISVTAHTAPSHGSVSISANGAYTYTPAAGYSGADSFTYAIADVASQTAGATVNLTVSPVAADDSFTTPFNTTLVRSGAQGVLANDVGTGLSAVLNAVPAHGSLTLNSDGSFTYTPTGGYAGPDSFTYHANDGSSSSSVATVSLTVSAPAAPVANNDSGSTQAGSALTVSAPGVLGNDTGTGISVTGHTAPSHGSVSISANGSYTYTPAAGYSGGDSFSYTITDVASQTATATVSLTVQPSAGADSYTTPFNTNLVRNAAQGVLANDVGTGLSAVLNAGPAHGSLTLNSDGSFTYAPTSGYSGPDSFTYHASDGTSSSGAATVSLTVSPPAAPVANNDAGTTTAGAALPVTAPGILGNDTGTGISVTGHTLPAHGTVSISANGAYTYTPNAGYSGPDSFSYTITDVASQTASATVGLTVSPSAADDSYTTPFNTTLVRSGAQGVLANDVGIGLTAVRDTSPAHGSISFSSDGSFTYTPTAGYTGPDSFTYHASDGTSSSSVATVSITVAAPAAPVAKNDTGSASAGSPLNVSAPGVLGNDSGTGITVTAHTSPSHGTVSISANGAYIYTPSAGYSGADSFSYTITDAASQTASATVSLQVAPQAAPGQASGPLGQPITLQPPPPTGSGPFTYQLIGTSLPPAADGTVVMNPATGATTFTPASDFVGSVDVQYTVTDGTGNVSPIALLTFTITPFTPPTPAAGTGGSDVGAGTLLLLLGWGAVVLGRRTMRVSGRPGSHRGRQQK